MEQAATEDYSLHIVPRTWRMDRRHLTMAWYAVMTVFFYLYFAAFLALAYGTVNALIGIVLSVIVYSLVNIAIVRAASRSGLTVALFSRSMFGFVGASIATLIFAVMVIYYTVFEGSVIAVAAADAHRRADQALVRRCDPPHRPAGVEGRARPARSPERVAAALLHRRHGRGRGVGAGRTGYNGFLPDAEASARHDAAVAPGLRRLHGSGSS